MSKKLYIGSWVQALRLVAQGALSLIAQRELGNTIRWEEIWKLNTERVANPNLIYPRLVLLMPQ